MQSLLSGSCNRSTCTYISSCQQETLHGLRRPGEGIWSSTSEGYLVGDEKTWCGGVDCETGAGDVCKCIHVGEGYSEEFEVKVGVYQGSILSPLLFINVIEALSQVPIWGPLGGPLCRWPCYHRWIAWGMCQEALDLEGSNGEERTESKSRKDKDHDMQYGTGPPAEFRRVSMRHLSHWSGQKQHLLQ